VATIPLPQTTSENWYSLDSADVIRTLASDASDGLSSAEAQARLAQYGPNELPKESPPSMLRLALEQASDPMNAMLIVVTVLSFLIGQTGSGILVGLLVLIALWTGTRQQVKAQASVAALESMTIPKARVVRDGGVQSVEANDIVPGDIVMVEAGDLVPADGRILQSATLEAAEAALTGESAPVSKDPATLPTGDVALGDRHNMLYQNTSVTRGTATMVVTGTGLAAEMGKIATMLQGVKETKTPLEQELAQLTRWIGFIAWGAVAIIFIIGLLRGLPTEDLVLLAILTAISAIPTGLPAFVIMMLATGAQRLAEAKAVVKSLNDVETLGATSAINSDKTGTLTMNEMTATSMLAGGHWYSIQGSGYEKRGAILSAAGNPAPDFQKLALGLALCSDATVSDDGRVIGDPTEAALVVLAAKVGTDAEITRREFPRLTQVPFDSAYKFMATFHRAPNQTVEPIYMLVKGAPDVVLDHSSHALWQGERVPIADVRAKILEANTGLSERGLRVLSFAFRSFPEAALADIEADPMAQVNELTFISLIGIIDPLRPEARDAVQIALAAGIDVRMITGDHAITARAIADELGLGDGVITGTDFQKLSDDELRDAIPHLHVFGRVAPEDKLRLVDAMQATGQIVAMTGDAVNDAAALKKADVGVAMGSGSEVSKQAARMVLTDDNFATLVKAVELGRDIYDKIVAYIGFQLVGMLGLLVLMLLATILNVNAGVALTPAMILFISPGVSLFPVIAIQFDAADPAVMKRRPRDPKEQIVNRKSAVRWLIAGLLLGVASIIPLLMGPDQPSLDTPSLAMTMAFAVSALGVVLVGIVGRHPLAPATQGPITPFYTYMGVAILLVWLGVELGAFQRLLGTMSLPGDQWLAVLVLSLLAPAYLAVDQMIRRRLARAAGKG
jgi:P-type Ca2+ transporter type 2C